MNSHSWKPIYLLRMNIGKLRGWRIDSLTWCLTDSLLNITGLTRLFQSYYPIGIIIVIIHTPNYRVVILSFSWFLILSCLFRFVLLYLENWVYLVLFPSIDFAFTCWVANVWLFPIWHLVNAFCRPLKFWICSFWSSWTIHLLILHLRLSNLLSLTYWRHISFFFWLTLSLLSKNCWWFVVLFFMLVHFWCEWNWTFIIIVVFFHGFIHMMVRHFVIAGTHYSCFKRILRKLRTCCNCSRSVTCFTIVLIFISFVKTL
jgi:hypothetical protein